VNFVYSGLWAGAIAGELRRRAAIWQARAILSIDDLKLNFHVAALAALAVILKIMEWLDLYGLFPGRNAFGMHLLMFLPVLLWNPILCKFLWKYLPRSAPLAISMACVAGIAAPVVVSYALGYPSMFLFYLGVPLAYSIPWGARFADATGMLKPVLLLAPGIAWGLVIGWLGWRYRGPVS
jgi:hypothetical protein